MPTSRQQRAHADGTLSMLALLTRCKHGTRRFTTRNSGNQTKSLHYKRWSDDTAKARAIAQGLAAETAPRKFPNRCFVEELTNLG